MIFDVLLDLVKEKKVELDIAVPKKIKKKISIF